MANHRAPRGQRRATSEGTRTRALRITRNGAPATSSRSTSPGKRAARPAPAVPTPDVPQTVIREVAPARPAPSPAPVQAAPVQTAPAAVQTTEAPVQTAATPRAAVSGAPGRRKAERAASPRSSLFSGFHGLSAVPSMPVIAGVAALAVSAGGALSISQAPADLTGTTTLSAATSISSATPSPEGEEVAAALLEDREEIVSRDSRREAEQEQTEAEQLAEAEQAAAERSQTLKTLTNQAEKQAEKIEANQWVMPLSGYRISATYGLSSSLWSSVHTGLDFAAPSGTPLQAVANGTVTEVGYDGSYGNKIVLTLDDGTEVWYCHLSSFGVSVGTQVTGGDYLGGVGSTGNSTGPHLHLEIRPGGGGPVDPYGALLSHGLQP